METVRHNQFKITFISSYDSYSLVASIIVTKNFHLLRTFLEKEASKEESDNFFNSILPKIQNLCLNAETYFPESPKLLRKHSNQAVYFTQYQCGIILGSVRYKLTWKLARMEFYDWCLYSQMNWNKHWHFSVYSLGEIQPSAILNMHHSIQSISASYLDCRQRLTTLKNFERY